MYAVHVLVLGTYLGVKHDLGGAIPARCNVLRQETRVIVVGIRHSCETEVAYLYQQKQQLRIIIY